MNIAKVNDSHAKVISIVAYLFSSCFVLLRNGVNKRAFIAGESW